jgi:hypothetical protein
MFLFCCCMYGFPGHIYNECLVFFWKPGATTSESLRWSAAAKGEKICNQTIYIVPISLLKGHSFPSTREVAATCLCLLYHSVFYLLVFSSTNNFNKKPRHMELFPTLLCTFLLALGPPCTFFFYLCKLINFSRTQWAQNGASRFILIYTMMVPVIISWYHMMHFQ